MFKDKEYINTLKGKQETPKQWLHKEEGYGDLLKVVDYYKDYINDKEKLLNEIIYKIDKYCYFNSGVGRKEKWKYNKHVVIINGERFEYNTGLGINCQAKELRGYAQEKIVFDVIISLMSDANCVYNNDMDDFIKEYGYDNSLENVREGEQVYRSIKENTKKLLKIFSCDTIYNILDIIEL